MIGDARRGPAPVAAPPLRVVGTAQRRVDALGKVTGAARFADDVNVAHQLWGAVLRAPHPHCRVLAIDTDAALALDGVEAVLTAADIPGEPTFGVVVRHQAILVTDRCRYLGDGLALVAARSQAIARAALARIVVRWEPLPVITDTEQALAPEAPRLHADGNVCAHHRVRRGDVAAGFAAAELVLEHTYRTARIEHAYLEPEAVLAEPGEHGGVRVTGSVQNLYSTRRSVAAALAVDLAQVEIVQATLGGSFGGKDEVMTAMCCRAALLARATGRPVKMVNSREESMLESYKRHPYTLHYRLGATHDGRLTAMEIRCVADAGAYASQSPFVTWRSAVQATGPYACPNVNTEVLAVHTNNTYTGAMRGFGAPQVNFAIESLMDELAERLGKDPLEVRLLNAFADGAVTPTGQTLPGRVSIRQVLEQAASALDFPRRWRANREQPPGPRRRGIGLACSYRGVSLGAEGTDAAGAVVSVQTDGSVIVSSGLTDMGQGLQTQMAQIAAEVLGVSMQRVRFLNTNTSRTPDSGPTVASRGTIMGGSAAKRAAETVRATLLEAAAAWLAREAATLELRDDHLADRASGARLAGFGELAAECFRQGRPLYGFGWHQAPPTSWDEEHGRGDAYFTFVYGANVAEVEVDVETGKVEVIDFVSCHDVGRAISPPAVLGQICGGVAMGIGYALLEDFALEDGIPQQLNFDEYLIPTALDVPCVRAIVVENPDPAGPYGAKSIAEPATEIAAPAIANAVANATGHRLRELPLGLERVLLGHALGGRGTRGSLAHEAATAPSSAAAGTDHAP